MLDTNRLVEIELDDSDLPAPTPTVEQERKVAIFDLLEANNFALPSRDGVAPPPGPYRLDLAIRERRLVFDISKPQGETIVAFHFSLSPFRQVIKDYFKIVESYYNGAKNLPASQLEAIDMARRGIHDEGARILIERLDGKVDVDHDTARRIFTLICVLYYKG